MVYAAGRKEKIVDVLGYIETRLKELEAEKEELRKYQKLDRARRAIEYTIHTRDHYDCTAKLTEVLLFFFISLLPHY